MACERLIWQVRRSTDAPTNRGRTHQQVWAFRVLLSGDSVNFDAAAEGIDDQQRRYHFRFQRCHPQTTGLLYRAGLH